MMFCVDSKDCAKVQKNPLMAKHIFIFFASPGVYLSALSARFSAARDEGRQKQPSGGEKSRFFDRISRRERKNCNFLMELAVGSGKIAIFYRKSEKTALPTPWKVKNTHFLRFQPLGKSKTLNFCVSNPLEKQKCPENRPSSADETKKTAKTARRRPTKRKKRQKLSVVGRRNAESPKNCASSTDDERKMAKSAFHPWMKSEKREKERFRHGGKSKTSKNHVSATAENQNHSKTALPPGRKNKITQKPRFRHGGKSKSGKTAKYARLSFRQTNPRGKTCSAPGDKTRQRIAPLPCPLQPNAPTDPFPPYTSKTKPRAKD